MLIKPNCLGNDSNCGSVNHMAFGSLLSQVFHVHHLLEGRAKGLNEHLG